MTVLRNVGHWFLDRTWKSWHTSGSKINGIHKRRVTNDNNKWFCDNYRRQTFARHTQQ